jgi:hypothetical protein
VSDEKTSQTTTVWLSGGTSGTEYDVTNRITTALGRVLDLVIAIRVLEKADIVSTYATKGNVAIISGKNANNIDELFLTIANREVERICGRSFGATASQTEYFDTKNRNVFVQGDIGSRDFVLSKHPVVSITSVQTIRRYSDANQVIQEIETTLDADDDYYLHNDDGQGIIHIPEDYELAVGPKSLKVVYTWGYANIPNDVKDFADYFAAMLADNNFNIPTNASGHPLAEVEIGRYREKYADISKVQKGKYSSILARLEDILVTKYKLWD